MNVRVWAKIASQELIANQLGIGVKTLRQHFRKELDAGKFEAVATVGGKLLQKALGGNLTAMIFYLRTQGKWNTRIEHTGADGGPIETRQVDLSEALDGITEEQLAAIEPILERLIAAGGGSFDFRALLGADASEGEAG